MTQAAALPPERAASPCPPAGSAAGVPAQCDAVPPWCWNWADYSSTPAGSGSGSAPVSVSLAVAAVGAVVAGAASSPDWRQRQCQAELRTER